MSLHHAMYTYIYIYIYIYCLGVQGGEAADTGQPANAAPST